MIFNCCFERKLPAKITLLSVFLLLTFYSKSQVRPTSADERMKGLLRKKELEMKSLVNGIKFRSIGPAIMSGRVVDIDANPSDPTEFYVAYASGGVWYTKNNGQSFVSIFDSANVLTIGDIAVNWHDHIIWVGTGEVNSSRSSYAGNGIYKSADNGKSWEYLGLPESHHIGKIQLHPSDKNIAWVAVLGHLYSPNKERGVYKTIDGGQTWKQTLFVDDNTGAVDVDLNQQNPDEVYATTWYKTRTAWNFQESGKTSGIYKSMDGGNTWQFISKEGSGFPTGEKIGRIGVAVSSLNPKIVYAVVDNNFHRPDTARKNKDTSKYVLHDFEHITKDELLGLDDRKLDTFLRKNRIPEKYSASSLKELVRQEKLKPTVVYDYLYDANTALFETPIIGCEVYKSENGGQSWKKMNEKGLALYNTYGYYFGKIYVSPNNDQKLIITGYDIELSQDGGKSWKKIDKPNVHGDHHACWIDPKKDSHFIIGNDGGCNITYDDGANWFKANMPAVGQFYSVVVDDAKPYYVYGGLQDNGVWSGPSTYKENTGWHQVGEYAYKMIMGGDGMQVQVDTRDNNTVYCGFQFGNYYRIKKNSGSADEENAAPEQGNGISSPENSDQKLAGNIATAEEDKPLYLKPQQDLGEQSFRFNWQSPIWLSRYNQDIIYFGSNKFHRSLQKGKDMETLSNDLTTGKHEGNIPYGTITTIAESPLKFGLLYAGTDDGNIQISRDGGYTWTLLNPKSQRKPVSQLPTDLWVSRIIASKYKEGRVYVTLNGYRFDNFTPYVFVSDDFGNTWKQLGKDLPSEPINVVREDPKYDSIIYIGTDGGLYVSLDSGNNFMAWSSGLPKSVPVHDIAIQERENEIVLGTHGRSLYVAKLDSIGTKMNKNGTWMK